MMAVSSVADMRACARQARRDGLRVALVPTMGYLHDGHLSLVRLARACGDRVVVSIYVNPTQFGPGEDFARYPRDLARDRALCEGAGVDVLFLPGDADLYPEGWSTTVEEARLSSGLCGAHRPGHFRGVTTVVAKLFNIVQPDAAVFGCKDFQQVRVIERMTRDLCFPVRIVRAPTLREPDGLAMSSRNAYLSAGERQRAAGIRRALAAAEERHAAGERAAEVLRRAVVDRLAGVLDGLDYVAVVDGATLEPVAMLTGPALVAVAGRIGRTRLIDNTLLGAAESGAGGGGRDG